MSKNIFLKHPSSRDKQAETPAVSVACIVARSGSRGRCGGEPIASHQPPEVCLFINKRYSTGLGAVCITNLKEANLEAADWDGV
ncbi:unnamed protein product [Danaus chrysippus]|uniref:(African queen) hypothetical protein n=1 Tax=Danaus chrysippus TaxID=151541 RepID=A0A8J2QJF7_9NEOP|nr:unnamed protein product [Danaus chrysippus]